MVALFRRRRLGSVRRSRPGRETTRLGMQRLEHRHALAFSANAVPLTTQPATFAWDIVIDDAVDAQGLGRDLYIRRGDDASPYALIADNPEFRDSQRLGLLTGLGPATTFYVTTGGQQAQVVGSVGNGVTNLSTGVYSFLLPKANPLSLAGSVVLQPGVSFTYEGVGLQANTPNSLTLQVNNATAWGNAGFNTTPTGTITTLNGVSTLTFRLFDASDVPRNAPGFALTNSPYQYFNPFPNQPFSFNVVAGQQFNQRLIVDLAGTGSRISMQSPWSASLGDTEGETPGVDRDPLFYSAYSGLDAKGQVCLYASEVSFSQSVNSVSTIDVGDARGRSDRVTVSGDLLRGSALVTNLPASKISDIAVNDFVEGPGIPVGTQVTAIDPINSTVTLSSTVSVTVTKAALTFITSRPSGYIGLPYALDVTSSLQSPALNVLLSGNDDRDAAMFLAQSGKFTKDPDSETGSVVTIRGSDTNVYVEGLIDAVSQNYILRSSNAERQFALTTRSRATGATVGTIGGGVLAVNLGNIGGTTFDVRTQLNELRIDSGVDTQGLPYRNAITVTEAEVAADPLGDGKLTISAVAASSGPITISTDDELTLLGSAIRTSGDLTINSGGAVLTLPATVTTGNGALSIRGPALSAGSLAAGGTRAVELVAGQSSRVTTKSATPTGSTTLNVSATARLAVGMLAIGPGIPANTTITQIVGRVVTLSAATTAPSASGTSITFVSVGGDAAIDAGVVAGGGVKERVRVATNMPLLSLSGLLAVDGVNLGPGDRVLVKNQANAAQNGIYVASSGSWARATDASLSTQFIPGFVVYAEEGSTQEGGWCFSNSFTPVMGETGLTFQPVTAARTYTPVRLATTENISLFGVLGLVDGRTVNVGDRILVKDQTNAAENGVYVVAAGRWQRADQADEVVELTTGSYVAVQRSGVTLDAYLVSTDTINLVSAAIANVQVGWLAEGTGIPTGTVVTEITAFNEIRLSQSATATRISAVTFTPPTVVDSGAFNSVNLDGTLTNGNSNITGLAGPNGLTASAILPGMSVKTATGVGLPAGTTVDSVNSSTNSVTLSLAADQTSPFQSGGDLAAGSSTITNTGTQATDLKGGMTVSGVGIPPGTTITSLAVGTVAISQPAIATSPQYADDQDIILTAGSTAVTGLTAESLPPELRIIQGMSVQSQSGFGFQNGTTVASVTNNAAGLTTGVTLSSPATTTNKQNGTYFSGDNIITGLNAANSLSVGMTVSGPGIAVGTTITKINNTTDITISSSTTALGTNKLLTFGIGKVAFTAGPFTYSVGSLTFSANTTTAGSDIVGGLQSTAELHRGMVVHGAFIPAGATVTDILGPTTIRISLRATGTAVGTPLSFFERSGVTNSGRAFALANDALQVGVTPLQFAAFTVQAARTNTWSPQRVTESVRVATTGDITLAGLQTIDGVAVQAGDRVLVKNQNDILDAAAGNGIWEAQAGAWNRLGDPLPREASVFVREGASGQGTTWIMNDSVRLMGQLTAGSQFVSGVASTAGLVAGMLATGPGIKTGTTIEYVKGSTVRLSTPALLSEPNAIITFTGIEADGSVQLDGLVTTGSPLVFGLTSTTNLVAGMLVTGPGIVAGTTIRSVVNGNCVQLSKPAIGTFVVAPVPLTFTAVEPYAFIPAGGAAGISAAGSIQSSTATSTSRVVGGTTFLAAGRRPDGAALTVGVIDARLTTGRVTATAPESIFLDASGTLDVVSATTTTTGGVTIAAENTLVARSIAPATADGVPSPVFLTSALGDVVATAVTTGLGDISLRADGNGRVFILDGGLLSPGIAAQSGSVSIVTDNGQIDVASLVTAGGIDSDVSFRSASSFLRLQPTAIITATDQLLIDTPRAELVIQSGATIVADRLSITAAFGSQTSPSAALGAFTAIEVNRTDPGDIVLSSPVALTIEGATTVRGSIHITAPSLNVAAPSQQVTGGISAGTLAQGDGSVTLVATSGSIGLGATVAALGDRVTLNASAGTIVQTGGLIDARTLVWYATSLPSLAGTYGRIGANLTAAGNLSLGTSLTPIVIVGASTVSGTITINGSSVTIVDTIKAAAGDPVVVTAANGNIDFVANTLGAIVSVPSATTPGSVTLSAVAGQVIGNNKLTRTTVRGGPLTITAQSADLKLNVSTLASTTTLSGLTASAVGTLALAGVTAPGQPVSLAAVSGMSQTGGIVAASLAVANVGGTANLDLAANVFPLARFTSTGVGGSVRLKTSSPLTVTDPSSSKGSVELESTSGDVNLFANITADDRITLRAPQGKIQQAPGTGISAPQFVWHATSSPFASPFTATYADIGSNLTAAGPLSIFVTPSQRVLTSSTVDGPITISGPSVLIAEPVTVGGSAANASVVATAGTIELLMPFSLRPSVNAPSGIVSLSASGLINTGLGSVSGAGITVTSGGIVLVGSMVASGPLTIVTTTAGVGVDVGPQPDALLQAGSMDLTGVQGPVQIRNGGRIIGLGANSLYAPPAPPKIVTFPDQIGSSAILPKVIDAVNLLPSPPTGMRYELTVGASIALTKTLTVSRPVRFVGTSTAVVLSGSPAVTSGLVLSAGASGSVVRNIAFKDFAVDAIRANGVSAITINKVLVTNSVTGGTGIRLTNVTDSMIGGTTPGAGNTLSKCATGIFAEGLCSGTRLARNSFQSTTASYNLRASRGITLVS